MIDYIKNNFKTVLIFGGLGLAVYLFTIYLTFPYERIFDSYIEEVQHRYNMELKTSRVSPALPLGIKAESVLFSSLDITGGETIKLDELVVKIPVLGAILYPFTKAINLNYKIELGKGSVSGNFRANKETANINLETRSLDLKSIEPLMSSAGISFKGNAKSSLSTTMNREALSNFNSAQFFNSEGELDIDITDFKIEGKPISTQSYSDSSQFMGFLGMLPVFSKIKFKMVINKGLLQIRDLYVEKEGLKGNIKGGVRIQPDLLDSIIDINMDLKLAPTESLIKPLLELYGRAIGCPLNTDNSVSCKINGTVGEITSPY